MNWRFQTIIALLLPILVQAVDVDRIISSVRSIAVKHQQLPRVLLSSSGSYPYVVSANEMNSECVYDGSTCRMRGYITVANAAPRPESDIGKFAASVSGKSFVCASHKTAKECLADTANKCDVYQIPYSYTNTTKVEVCDVGFAELTRMSFDFGLCPNSLADQLMTCLGVKETIAKSDNDSLDFLNLMSPSGTCTSRDGISCELLGGAGGSMCIPTNIKKQYDLTSDAGLTAMTNDLLNKASKFYGCCPGGKLLAQEVNCQSKTTQAACAGSSVCTWQALDASDSNDPFSLSSTPTMTGICIVSSSAYLEMISDVDTAFGRYIGAASDKCKAIAASACDSTPKIVGLNITKATENSKLQFAKGGGACSGKGTSAANSAHRSSMLRQLSYGLAAVSMALFVAVQWA